MLLRDRDLAPAKKKGLTRQQALIGAAVGLALGLLTRFAVHAWLVYPFTPQSASMAPTLKAGEQVFVWRGVETRNLKRGQVVLLRHPVDRNRYLLSRVVALPGEQIQIHERQVYIQNKALASLDDGRWEKEIQRHSLYRGPPDPNNSANRDFHGPLILKENQIYVLGDNRAEAFDSRQLGPLDPALITGRISTDD